MRAWLALFAAIAFEVTGTLTLKLSALNHHAAGLAATYVFLALSYALLSLAFRRIPVAVAFAVWEAAGLAIVTLAGVILLGETLSPTRLLALLGLGLGAWLLHGGTTHAAHRVSLRRPADWVRPRLLPGSPQPASPRPGNRRLGAGL